MIDWQKNLAFEKYEQVKSALETLIAPLQPLFTERSGHLKLGTSGTVYKEDTRQIEAYLRLLWGIGPLLSQADNQELKATYLKGIIAGTDPEDDNYWGDVTDYDQLLVEMASLSLTLMLAKEKTWDVLNIAEQTNLANWLRQINDHSMPANNWHFFRVLVNICLKKMGAAYSQELLDDDLNLIDSFYVGKGWYYDGEETQRDYYIPWAFHYYGLIYAKIMAADDPERAARFKNRARDFAQSYRHLFDAEGAGIPFGRSLAYRFGQAAFWSALVFADVEALPWSEIKGLYARNMSYWFKQDILDRDGILNIGYAYDNLVMAEGYNAPGSPYWAFKSFLLLAVPKDHPYWQADALPFRPQAERYLSLEGRAFYEHVANHHHTLMYPFGQSINFQNHSAAKYSKFVYSTKFGFSVPKSTYYFYEGALDNVFSVSEDGYYFRPKAIDLDFEATDEFITYHWQPYQDVDIQSTIIPCGDYHVRIQQVETKRELIAYESGFSNRYESENRLETETLASYQSSVGISSIESVYGFDKAKVIRPEPNTNLLHNRTLMPVLEVKLSVGKHLLVSIVGGIADENLVSTKPKVSVTPTQVIVTYDDKELKFNHD